MNVKIDNQVLKSLCEDAIVRINDIRSENDEKTIQNEIHKLLYRKKYWLFGSYVRRKRYLNYCEDLDDTEKLRESMISFLNDHSKNSNYQWRSNDGAYWFDLAKRWMKCAEYGRAVEITDERDFAMIVKYAEQHREYER